MSFVAVRLGYLGALTSKAMLTDNAVQQKKLVVDF